jgi:hypothetical protein
MRGALIVLKTIILHPLFLELILLFEPKTNNELKIGLNLQWLNHE